MWEQHPKRGLVLRVANRGSDRDESARQRGHWRFVGTKLEAINATDTAPE